MDKKLRKQETLLADAGMGTILFAVWAVVKVNLYMGSMGFFLENLRSEATASGINAKLLMAVLGVVFAGVLLVQFGSRLYIGVSAIQEGKGKKKGWAYLVVAVMTLIAEGQTFWLMLFSRSDKSILNAIVSLCFEAASVYVLLELLVCGILVKYMRKQKKA